MNRKNRNSIPRIQVGIPGLKKSRKQKKRDNNPAEKESVQKLAVSLDYI